MCKGRLKMFIGYYQNQQVYFTITRESTESKYR